VTQVISAINIPMGDQRWAMTRAFVVKKWTLGRYINRNFGTFRGVSAAILNDVRPECESS
jgi:hypothetical protein